MFPLNEQQLYTLHQLNIEEADRRRQRPQLPPRPSALRTKLTNGTTFLSHLRRIRVQVTFEVSEPQPKRAAGC